jgi:hypothetical protein
MKIYPCQVTTKKALTSILAPILTIFLAVGVSVRSQEQADWKQWTPKDVHTILTKSPWVSRCCRDWDTTAAAGEAGADPGYVAIIVSSRTVRQALVRHMQSDNRYEKVDSASRQDLDQRIDACLSEKFDDDLILSFSFLGNPGLKQDTSYLNRIYIITSDGRKVAGRQLPVSVAMTCGAFPHESDLNSLRIGTSEWPPLGPRKEVAFPRLVDGKPTISPTSTTIRVDSGFRGRQPASYSEFDFTIDKLINQGKPDF